MQTHIEVLKVKIIQEQHIEILCAYNSILSLTQSLPKKPEQSN